MIRAGMLDPFLPEESDPLKTQAIDSSIWEVASLSSHYLASVSGLAKVFNQQLTKQNYDMEDFLDHTYASVSSFLDNKSSTLRRPVTLMPSAPSLSDVRYRDGPQDQDSTSARPAASQSQKSGAVPNLRANRRTTVDMV